MATNVIEKVMHIDANLVNDIAFDVEVKINNVRIECGLDHEGGGKLPYYNGDYTVTPKAYDETTLPTKNKSLKDDIKVLVIPTDTVSNEFGYTFAIAREEIELA